MSVNSSRPKRPLGCLSKLLILVLFVGACYLLLLAPLPERDGDQTVDATTPEVSAEKVNINGEVNETQQAALEKLLDETGENVEALAQNGQIQFVELEANVPDSVAVSDQEKVLYFLNQNPQILELADLSRALRYAGRRTNPSGNTSVTFTQQYQGVPVHASNIVVLLNKDSNVINISANYAPALEISVAPAIRSRQAEETALQDLQAEDGKLAYPTTLEIYAPEVWLEDSPEVDLRELRYLAWFVTVRSESIGQSRLYIIDAQTGEVLENKSLSLELAGQINLEIIQIRDGNRTSIFKEENGQHTPVSLSQPYRGAYDNIKRVHQYYYDTFDRDSFDNNQAWVRLHISIGCTTEASWDPDGQYLFVCEDWGLFPDVIAHEYTHAVAGNMIGFQRDDQEKIVVRGLAVHEALADIFAVFASAGDDETLWQINGLPPERTVISDLKNPLPNWPRRYQDRYWDREIYNYKIAGIPLVKLCPEKADHYPDCGHINGIILSHAAFLMSEGGDKGGDIPRNKLQYLFYSTMESGLLQPSSNLRQAAKAIHSTCKQIIGRSDFIENKVVNDVFSNEDCRQVHQSFYTVGLMSLPPFSLPSIDLPTIPKAPSPLPTFINLIEGMREAVDNLLGDWSPLKFWEPIQKEIDRFRNNYWVKLLECIKNSDQACIDKYAVDLVQAVFEAVMNALSSFCSGMFVVPAAIFVARRKWMK